MAALKVELCLDKIPKEWVDIFMGASPARKWVMLTSAHRNPPIEVSFGECIIHKEPGEGGEESETFSDL